MGILESAVFWGEVPLSAGVTSASHIILVLILCRQTKVDKVDTLYSLLFISSKFTHIFVKYTPVFT